ncbi:beta-N-acetylhexosaminidase [Lederbergia sp. NSJ-179]|uniref:beta-N-acetylhexosaminidase n=1 Tax=Lederbergia sp. NSJ-179 TaxID=2931402 RepID=UPI001FD2619B|nr:beta-N-acetylhexosaminidase [Lederbergia sp. NSJ-179]MCJ7840107.1 beta-N-acetylhexosaminidase [Lederbergia sp. NSJ-179]
MTRKVLICLAVLLVGMVAYFTWKDRQERPIQPEDKQDRPAKVDRKNKEAALIQDIFTLAKRGKVPNAPFIAGESTLEEVHTSWGDPEKTDSIADGRYESYRTGEFTIGYQMDRVFDVRSYHQDLQSIHLDEIKRLKGEPNETRSYQDNNVDQIILVYQVTESEQLKWILPKPTKSDANPVVDHISVYSDRKKKLRAEENISEQLKAMNLREKVGQMIFAGVSGTVMDQETEEFIRTHQVGGMIFYAENLQNTKQMITLLNDIKAANEQNPFPLLLGVDQEGGRISRFPDEVMKLPTNEEIGVINQPTFSYEIGQLLGEQVKAFGFNLDFAPVLDINSNPNNPVINDRSFGNDAKVVSRLGIETMKGIQSQHIMSVIKHFPGHGDTAVDSHLDLPVMDKSMEEMKQLEIIPFQNAINQGADIVMVAHILLSKMDPTYPSSMSEKVITDLLRKQLHFKGVVMTDDMTMQAITKHYDIGEASVQSVKAGSDIILIAHGYDHATAAIDAIVQAVEAGEWSEDRIDDSVRRILELKKNYGVHDQAVQKVDVKALNQAMEEVLNKYQ